MQTTSKTMTSIPVLNQHAAGIDIGATHHHVAVPQDAASPCVRKFEAFTEDLVAIADWLRTCHVQTVAMESTGVYWIPLYQILEERGFKVCLVNSRDWRNAPGHKTDVDDCQWLQYLPRAGCYTHHSVPISRYALYAHFCGIVMVLSPPPLQQLI
jgi:hypothetical protein